MMTSATNRPNWIWRFIIAVVVLLIVGGATFLGVMMTGHVHGTEFSPQTFAQRAFWYYRLPFVHIRVTGTYYDSVTGTMVAEADVAGNLTTGATAAGPIRWDLCDYRIGGNSQVPGEALILLQALSEKTREQENFWNEWTKENSALAKELWPAVQQLAIHECYFAIPELLEVAATKPTISELQSAVAEISQIAANDRARQLLERREDSRAFEIVRWGLGFGSHDQLDELRSKLQEASNNP